MNIRLPLCAFAALIVCFGAIAHADAPKATPLPAPDAGPATVFTYAKENPDCLEWTNACQTCKRNEAGVAACSTAGIACTPGALVCKAMKPK